MMLVAALDYARHGRSVFPCAGKCPRLAGWPTQATTNEETLSRWWRVWPDANIGMPTGAVNDVVTLDVDGEVGANSLRALERDHDAFPETVINLTGGGGRHLLFRHPGVPIPNAVGLWPGIDVRGDGGFIIVPPSRTVGPYAWEIGHELDAIPLATFPAWLLEQLRRTRTAVGARPPDTWAALIRGPITEGQRNDSIARLTGYLFRRRPAPRVVLELVRAVNEARCQPPLPDQEIERTVDSIARREVERTRHVDAER